MRARKVTSISIITVITILLGLEGWLLGNSEKNDTISEVINEAAERWMIIPVLVGIIIGHWFWPLHKQGDNNAGK